MANANEIANILSMVATLGTAPAQDTLSEFTQKVNKENLVKQNKQATNAKWFAWDVAASIGGMVINHIRQKQFEHLQENAEAKADEQLQEREQKLDTLKENLGIKNLEERAKKQDETLQNIEKMISHLVAEQKKEKKEKEVKNLPKVKLNKEHAKKAAKVGDDEYWL